MIRRPLQVRNNYRFAVSPITIKERSVLTHFNSTLKSSATRSAIIMVGAAVLPEVI